MGRLICEVIAHELQVLAVSISMNIVPTKYFGEHDEHKESHCCGQKIAPYLQRPHISSSDCAPKIQCFSIPVNIWTIQKEHIGHRTCWIISLQWAWVLLIHHLFSIAIRVDALSSSSTAKSSRKSRPDNWGQIRKTGLMQKNDNTVTYQFLDSNGCGPHQYIQSHIHLLAYSWGVPSRWYPPGYRIWLPQVHSVTWHLVQWLC